MQRVLSSGKKNECLGVRSEHSSKKQWFAMWIYVQGNGVNW